jgi:hypothetical protein
MIEIRHAFEEKIKEIGGEITGAGGLMVYPYTMDVGFNLNGIRYAIYLKNLDAKKPEGEEGVPDEG